MSADVNGIVNQRIWIDWVDGGANPIDKRITIHI